MLNICDSNAEDYGLLFNAKKSASVAFVKNSQSPRKDCLLLLEKEHVACREVITHLQVVMNAGQREVVVIKKRCQKYYKAVNSVVTQIGGVCKRDIA